MVRLGMSELWHTSPQIAGINPTREKCRCIIRNVADWSRYVGKKHARIQSRQVPVEGWRLSKAWEDQRRLSVRVLVSSLIPVLYMSSVVPSVEAGGFSASQQKAYDTFVQNGVSQDSSIETGVSRARQQQQGEKSRIDTALTLYTRAEENQKQGKYRDALQGYRGVIEEYPDLALAERARVKRALMEYQVGNTRECILHLQDEEVAVRGNPEVHAALAAVLYAERPDELDLAEEQWDIATEFDTRYASIDYVENTRYWPPAMVTALKKFLLLQRS